MRRAENGARTLEDLQKCEDKEYGRKIAKAQKVSFLSDVVDEADDSWQFDIIKIWNS
jgi:hypothetical protein